MLAIKIIAIFTVVLSGIFAILCFIEVKKSREIIKVYEEAVEETDEMLKKSRLAKIHLLKRISELKRENSEQLEIIKVYEKGIEETIEDLRRASSK